MSHRGFSRRVNSGRRNIVLTILRMRNPADNTRCGDSIKGSKFQRAFCMECGCPMRSGFVHDVQKVRLHLARHIKSKRLAIRRRDFKRIKPPLIVVEFLVHALNLRCDDCFMVPCRWRRFPKPSEVKAAVANKMVQSDSC